MSLGGVIPMLVAPFGPDGALVPNEIRRQAEHVLLEGSHGVAVNGLAGEAAALTTVERKVVAAAAVAAAGGMPVVVGASARTAVEAVELARDAAELGAAAVMVAPPPDPGMPLEALVEYYGTIAEAVAPTALMVQDAPDFVGVAVGTEVMAELRAAHANVRLAKPESTPAADAVAELVTDHDIGVFGGHGGLYTLDVLNAGAHGVIPGPDAVGALLHVYESWKRGDEPAARDAFERLLPLLVAEFQSLPCFIASVKRVLVARGVISRPDLRGRPFKIGRASEATLLEHARRAGVLTNVL